MIQKKNLFSLFLVFSSIPFSVYGEAPQLDCSYSGDFQECYDANQSWEPRSITDFVCLDRAGHWEQILSQIVLDRKFQELDEEIEDYLKKLEESKGEYFGNDKKDSLLRPVDDIYKNLTEYGYYGKKYMELCETGIIAEIAECGDGVAVWEAKEFLWWEQATSCKTLARGKLDVYREVSINLLKLNKVEVRKDERKEFVQKERGQYWELLDMMRTIIGHMERIMNGWPTKTRYIDN